MLDLLVRLESRSLQVLSVPQSSECQKRAYCWKVFRLLGLTWTLGSENPRTPAMVPKYYTWDQLTMQVVHLIRCWRYERRPTWSKDLFSNMIITTCLTSLKEPPVTAATSARETRARLTVIANLKWRSLGDPIWSLSNATHILFVSELIYASIPLSTSYPLLGGKRSFGLFRDYWHSRICISLQGTYGSVLSGSDHDRRSDKIRMRNISWRVLRAHIEFDVTYQEQFRLYWIPVGRC